MPPDHEVAEILPGHITNRPEASVVEGNLFAIVHTKAPVHASARIDFGQSISPGARIDRLVISSMRRLQCSQHILPRAGAGINGSRRLQPLESILVIRNAFSLVVGSERPADIRPLVPSHTQPLQILERGLRELLPAS